MQPPVAPPRTSSRPASRGLTTAAAASLPTTLRVASHVVSVCAGLRSLLLQQQQQQLQASSSPSHHRIMALTTDVAAQFRGIVATWGAAENVDDTADAVFITSGLLPSSSLTLIDESDPSAESAIAIASDLIKWLPYPEPDPSEFPTEYYPQEGDRNYRLGSDGLPEMYRRTRAPDAPWEQLGEPAHTYAATVTAAISATLIDRGRGRLARQFAAASMRKASPQIISSSAGSLTISYEDYVAAFMHRVLRDRVSSEAAPEVFDMEQRFDGVAAIAVDVADACYDLSLENGQSYAAAIFISSLVSFGLFTPMVLFSSLTRSMRRIMIPSESDSSLIHRALVNGRINFPDQNIPAAIAVLFYYFRLRLDDHHPAFSEPTVPLGEYMRELSARTVGAVLRHTSSGERVTFAFQEQPENRGSMAHAYHVMAVAKASGFEIAEGDGPITELLDEFLQLFGDDQAMRDQFMGHVAYWRSSGEL